MTMLETRLVRVDLPGCEKISCAVFSNGVKVGILSSLEYNDPGNCVLIPMQGNLRVVVTSFNAVLGSVTFPFSLLNESGCLWLPVKPAGTSDYIDVLPEELGSPKILLYFERKNSDDCEESVDELVEAKEKLRIITENYQKLIKTSKEREVGLLKSIEDKENELQNYLEELSRAQSRIFTLMAEKKQVSDSLMRLQNENSYSNFAEIKEELEITRQELLKSEARNEHLLQKLEEVACEWNFLEEESKHFKESELISQISQLKQDLEFKQKEIQLLTPLSNPILSEITNKFQEPEHYELTDTIKYSKPQKLKSSASTENLISASFNLESVQTSIILEDDSKSSMYSRGVSPGLKENVKKNSENLLQGKSSVRCPTISSQNKLRYIPIATSRRLNTSVEKRK